MYEYKVIKGTRRTLYLKGLKSRYFYFFCFIGGIGALGLVLTGLNGGLILHLFYALVFVIALYAFFFWLSLEKPFWGIKRTYSVIQNIDLVKILKK